MKRVILVAAVVLLALLLATPVLAAPPADPGKAPDDLEKAVFVHHKAVKPAQAKPPKANDLYSYSGYHWANNAIPVRYWINPAASPVSTSSAGIQASFQTWQDDPVSGIAFAYMGTTTVAPGLDVLLPDYRNVVGWADLSASYPDAIAITVIWWQRGTKLLVDCDTALNLAAEFAWTQTNVSGDPDFARLPDTPSYDCDVQNIMVHEAGHWLMLNDLYGTAAGEQTMYGYAYDGELKKRSLENGDIAGVRKIYR